MRLHGVLLGVVLIGCGARSGPEGLGESVGGTLGVSGKATSFGTATATAGGASSGFSATSTGGTAASLPWLSSLQVIPGTLKPTFDPELTEYFVAHGLSQASVSIVATTEHRSATLSINGRPARFGEPFEMELALGRSEVTVSVTTAPGLSRDYELVLERSLHLVEQSYLKPIAPDRGDRFGNALALDGNTLAIGACSPGTLKPPDEEVPADTGAVFVFERRLGAWVETAQLIASNIDQGDQFGCSVALDNDTLVVGAPGEDAAFDGTSKNPLDNSVENGGAVYVFSRTNDTWIEQGYLKGANAGEHAAFGSAVAVAGDTLVVGALESSGTNDGEQGSISGRGAAYVFVRTGGSWTEEALIKPAVSSLGDQFGRALALSADTLAVGTLDGSSARGINGNAEDDTMPGSGAVYVYARSDGAWSPEAYLKASNSEQADVFGIAVALDGDILAVGAPYEDSAARGPDGIKTDNRAVESGAVYVFSRSGGEWSEQAYLKSSNSDAADRFGAHLALDQELLAVGATWESSSDRGLEAVDPEDNFADLSGAVYLFTRTGETWAEQAYLKTSNADAGDEFGSSIAVQNGTLVVGAVGEASAIGGANPDPNDNSAPGSGAVYVFTFRR